MPTPTILRHGDTLRVLHKATPKVRRHILKSANKSLVKSLCECADNTLHGRVKLSPAQKSRLARYKNTLRTIARRGDTWQCKRRVLVQHGGAILPLLLGLLLGGIIGNLFQ